MDVCRPLEAFLACSLLALEIKVEVRLMADTRLLDILARRRVQVQCRVQSTEAHNQTPPRGHNGR